MLKIHRNIPAIATNPIEQERLMPTNKSIKKPVAPRSAAVVDDDDDDDDDKPAPRPSARSAKKPVAPRSAAVVDDDDDDDDDDDKPAPRPSARSAKKPVAPRSAAVVDDDDDDDDDDDKPAPRPSARSAKKPVAPRSAAVVDDDDDDDDDDDKPAPRPSARSASNPRKADPVAAMKEALASFLRKHGLASNDVLATLSDFGVNSLPDLKLVKEDPDLFADLKKTFQGRPIVCKALDRLSVDSIDTAIFYAQKPEREADAEALAEFLIEHDVLADGEEADKEILLRLLRGGGVTSLRTLKSAKESGKSDAKLKALTAKVTQWSTEAGASFESITFAMVAKGRRSGTPVASDELKSFLTKKGFPAGTADELADFDVTSLEDLKDVKEDAVRLGQLRTRLGDAGIRGATERLDRLEAADIEQRIAETHLPEVQEANARSVQLADAIDKAEQLRQKIEGTADAEFRAVKSEAEDQYAAVLAKINSISGAEFRRANTAALRTQEGLIGLLGATIKDARKAKGILDGVEKSPRTVSRIISDQEMLCGFLMGPDGAHPKRTELIKLPDSAQDVLKDPGAIKDFRRSYTGLETKSFAVSTAQDCSKTLAVAAETSGAAFVGTGLAAVSAAAQYADSQKETAENQEFESRSEAACGEVLYKYAPKKIVQFNRDKIRLSDDARDALNSIVALAADQQTDEIEAFYRRFGHTFLTECPRGSLSVHCYRQVVLDNREGSAEDRCRERHWGGGVGVGLLRRDGWSVYGRGEREG